MLTTQLLAPSFFPILKPPILLLSARQLLWLSKLPACNGASINLSYRKVDQMAEPSRSDAPERNPWYPEGADRESSSTGSTKYTQRELDMGNETSLPSGDIYGQPPRNRSAENLGRTVGSAVSGVLRFPQRVGQAGSRLRHAGRTTRANASAVVLDMMDTAAQRAEDLRRTTGETISEWTGSARRKTSQLGDRAAETWDDLRSSAKQRVDVASRRAAAQWNQAQRRVTRLQQEDPARFLAVVAGTAFVIGVGLRIWKANRHD